MTFNVHEFTVKKNFDVQIRVPKLTTNVNIYIYIYIYLCHLSEIPISQLNTKMVENIYEMSIG